MRNRLEDTRLQSIQNESIRHGLHHLLLFKTLVIGGTRVCLHRLYPLYATHTGGIRIDHRRALPTETLRVKRHRYIVFLRYYSCLLWLPVSSLLFPLVAHLRARRTPHCCVCTLRPPSKRFKHSSLIVLAVILYITLERDQELIF